MGMYVNPGSKAFQNAVNSQIYIDKTGLLEKLNRAVCTEQRCICISRPRRFGKSMAANMIRAYYSRGCDSSWIFSKYKISQTQDYNKYLNKFNVIHFDAAAFLNRSKDVDTTVGLIDQTLLGGLKNEFPQIINDSVSDTFSALIRIYENTQMQFVIIIDEWDCMIREKMNHAVLIEDYLKFLSMLFKSSESQDFLALGYMTGILPIKKFKGESALNNFCEYTMTEPADFAEYFGFTQEETQALCTQYQMNQSEITKWYDGYCLGTFKHIYNPNSLVQAVIKQSISSYWKNTAAYENLNRYILCNFEGLKDTVLHMLLGGQCRVNIDTFQNDLKEFADQNDILAALIHLGYLTYHADTGMADIPNEEVRMAFVSAIRMGGWKDGKEYSCKIEKYH